MSALIAIIFIVVVLAVVLIVGISIYNKLVSRRNSVDESFGQIETQLQRRFDLIPNLVATVKQYAKHESSVFEEITKARASAQEAIADGSTQGLEKADGLLRQASMQINAVAENYPDLKASANFGQLQEELTSTENKVSFARQAYNDSVNAYNTAREVFPSNIVAKMFKFAKRDMFEVDAPEVRRAVKVDFS